MLTTIWRWREFILSSVKKEFSARYKGSTLGAIWFIVQPLAMIIVYTVIFSEIMRAKLIGAETDKLAYSIYLCSGVLTWAFFSELLNRTVNVFLENANLLKKLSFPRINLPVITALSSLLNFCMGWVLFMLFLLIVHRPPTITGLVLFGVVLVVQMLFSVGLGLGLGVLNVFFRDVGQFVNVVLQFWFWFTPIVYPLVIIPQEFHYLQNFNPMYHLMKAYQDIFLYKAIPDFVGIFGVFVLSLLLIIWSLRLYRQHVGEMVDEL